MTPGKPAPLPISQIVSFSELSSNLLLIKKNNLAESAKCRDHISFRVPLPIKLNCAI